MTGRVGYVPDAVTGRGRSWLDWLPERPGFGRRAPADGAGGIRTHVRGGCPLRGHRLRATTVANWAGPGAGPLHSHLPAGPPLLAARYGRRSPESAGIIARRNPLVTIGIPGRRRSGFLRAALEAPARSGRAGFGPPRGHRKEPITGGGISTGDRDRGLATGSSRPSGGNASVWPGPGRRTTVSPVDRRRRSRSRRRRTRR